MNDAFGVKVTQTVQDLNHESFRGVFREFAGATNKASYGPSGYIFCKSVCVNGQRNCFEIIRTDSKRRRPPPFPDTEQCEDDPNF